MKPHLDPRVPLLERPDGLQLGVDPDHGCVAHGDPSTLRGVLGLMNGRRTVTDIATASGLPPAAVRGLVAGLAGHQLLAPRRRRTQPRLRLIGSGLLARDLAEAICATGSGDLTVVDPEPPLPRVYAYPRPTGGQSLRAHLIARGHQVGLDDHWYAERPGHDLTIVADDHVEPDRALTEVLMRSNRPHLFVRPTVRGVVVGPFVVPGQTACTRCMDLVRSRDPEWVGVLAQLCNSRLATPATQRVWAVGQVLVTLRAWAAGHVPATHGATWELDRDWAVASRSWPVHPSCGCSDAAAAA